MPRITCPDCLARAKGFLVPLELAKEGNHLVGKDRDGFILARDTIAELTEPWRQERVGGKRPAIWKPDHELSVFFNDSLRMSGHSQPVWHVVLRNRDNGLAQHVHLCDAPSQISLAGPGAEAHIAADRDAVAERAAKEHFDAFTTARKDATVRELDAYCKQLKAAFAALGFDVAASGGLMNRHAASIQIKPDDAAKLLEALGAPMAPRPIDPMPVWCVRYGVKPEDDTDPLVLGARNEAAVRAYMLANYCDERRDDGPNVPLVPEKLHIERIEEPAPPKKSDAA